jgi:hypothetical protein
MLEHQTKPYPLSGHKTCQAEAHSKAYDEACLQEGFYSLSSLGSAWLGPRSTWCSGWKYDGVVQ